MGIFIMGPKKDVKKPKQQLKVPAKQKERKTSFSREPGQQINEDDNILSNSIRPPDQVLDLTEEQLNKEIGPRMLDIKNPQAPHNTVQFIYKDKIFRSMGVPNQLVIHFQMEGVKLDKNEDDAKKQIDFEKGRREDAIINARKVEGLDEQIDVPDDDLSLKKSLRNQFNYSQRTSQALYSIVKDRGFSTKPPDTIT